MENIEYEMAVERVKHGEVSLWPIIKSYAIEYTDGAKVIKKANSSTIRVLLKGFLGDFISIKRLKKSPYWVFTNSERRYHVGQVSFDRITSGLQRYIGDYLLFEKDRKSVV